MLFDLTEMKFDRAGPGLDLHYAVGDREPFEVVMAGVLNLEDAVRFDADKVNLWAAPNVATMVEEAIGRCFDREQISGSRIGRMWTDVGHILRTGAFRRVYGSYTPQGSIAWLVLETDQSKTAVFFVLPKVGADYSPPKVAAEA